MLGRVKVKLKRLVKAVRGLSHRQIAGLLATATIGLGVAVASAAGRAALATSLLALLLVAVPAGVIHLSRRLGGVGRANREAVRDLRVLVEQVQRRVIAAVEKERLAAGDRHQELTEALSRAERLTGRGAELLLREQTQEIEALFQLFRRVAPRAPMPAGGALNPTDLLGLHNLAAGRKPRLTVVLGGAGPTAVWLGYALAGCGGRLVAVEYELSRVEATRESLREHGLTGVEVRHAPPVELTVDGRAVDWYDVDALDGLTDIDLLVVDGAEGVAPALHVLGRRLADGGAVVVEAPTHVAPRQGGFGLTEQRRVSSRWTVLAHPEAPMKTVK
ncbi:class I SAM-dependent methyltransferase [Actinoplanes sp. KI2]|uniref:class I SAM-dependent methyltransferase n=1 Tax=Actinoplanes sp. KI2 TaxID=2983315 RepID=UPI0021D5C240|nr:class I SAM-dependent methyltransferase [Actinoplanes sp. KI2]MCU7723680.1 class I SAM-dependent methyltransferase [Actinoplanes sp. KI2]